MKYRISIYPAVPDGAPLSSVEPEDVIEIDLPVDVDPVVIGNTIDVLVGRLMSAGTWANVATELVPVDESDLESLGMI